MKSRRKCNRDVPERRRPTAATRIANIAYKTRSYLEWDGAAERFRNGEGANRVLEYKYRAPYKLRQGINCSLIMCCCWCMFVSEVVVWPVRRLLLRVTTISPVGRKFGLRRRC
ncbi:MAG: hypothetical protein LC126_28595 [Bryobacterales bacterium]|nr:hypothetical protein [Bryobacterales bacterium]